MTTDSPIVRVGPRLSPDSRRVVARLFVPGEELPGHHSRATTVLQRVQDLSDSEVSAALADLQTRFAARHRDIDDVFLQHFELMAHRLGGERLPRERRLLIGAYFTSEYAVEGAALTNPSMVSHPEQAGLGPGEQRFVMSARAIGEGHISSIELRTGVVDAEGIVRIDDPGPYLDLG
ncbi:MAG: hypothetical protein WKF86_05190, partial [Acidimicrobiales bacterium]